MSHDTAADLVLDGNAVAGLLEAHFGRDMTAGPRGCQSCGATHAVGRHRLFRGAGLVLRCPACGDVAAIILPRGEELLVQLFGAWEDPPPAA